MFVVAHTEHCAGCASEWAFLQATKTAWTSTPMAVPSASLSARIAAATYRKPTFAERFVAGFAFLNPVPVRVAIGVAAVAGISFLALPRMTSVPEVVDSPRVTDPASVVARKTPSLNPVKASTDIAVAPVRNPVPTTKHAMPKPAVPVAEEAPVVATKSPAPKLSAPKVVAVAEKLAPKSATPVAKPKRTQVAQITPVTPRKTPTEPAESAVPDMKPSVREVPSQITVAAKPAPAVASVKPEPTPPVAVASAAVVGITAPETDPDFTGGSTRINLNNTNQPLPTKWSGNVVRTSSREDTGYSLVSIPAKM